MDIPKLAWTKSVGGKLGLVLLKFARRPTALSEPAENKPSALISRPVIDFTRVWKYLPNSPPLPNPISMISK